MSWKTAFDRYVRHFNKCDIDYNLESVLETVSDHAFISKEQRRIERLKEQHRDRGVQPLRNETRIRIDHLSKTGQTVEAEFILKKKFWYELKNKDHVEERIEKQKLQWFREKNDDWKCRHISHLQTDPVNGKINENETSHKHRDKNPPSQPYLNNHMLLPRTARYEYDRMRVKEYADLWWDHPNPEFIHFDVDCTNYVSQCIFAGGAPMNYTGRRDAGWWYRKGKPEDRWSFSWSVAHSLYWYLAQGQSGLYAKEVESPAELMIGDVIVYDFEGDSRYDHTTIVTAKDASGMPLVNAHTVNSKHRYWDYRDSYAWTENTKYRFFHLSSRA